MSFYISVAWLTNKRACTSVLNKYRTEFGTDGCDLEDIKQARRLIAAVGQEATADLLMVLLEEQRSFFTCRDIEQVTRPVALLLCKYLKVLKTCTWSSEVAMAYEYWDTYDLHKCLKRLPRLRLAIAVTEIAAALKRPHE